MCRPKPAVLPIKRQAHASLGVCSSLTLTHPSHNTQSFRTMAERDVQIHRNTLKSQCRAYHSTILRNIKNQADGNWDVFKAVEGREETPGLNEEKRAAVRRAIEYRAADISICARRIGRELELDEEGVRRENDALTEQMNIKLRNKFIERDN
jgi:hypothetical protein